MSRRGWLLVGAVAGVAVAVPVSGTAAALPRVPRYTVFQRSIFFRTNVANPWEQVQAPVVLTGPGGRHVSIGGFYAGGSTWEFRFAPTTTGVWHWRWRVADRTHSAASSGSFQAVPGGPGFVRVNPYNRFRWTFDDGAPFYPVGLQDCTVTLLSPNPLAKWGLDGGFTGGDYIHLGRWVDMNTYLSTYSRAGFDLWRWGSNNCSFSLYTTISPAGNVYSVSGGRWADTLFSTLRRYGFRIELVLFGNEPPFPNANAAEMAAIERYARYVADRYGAYADFWELMNEATVPDAWYTQVGSYLHRIDPYHHPIGTSWGRPQLPVFDFSSDHWYQTEDELDSDLVTWQRIRGEPGAAVGKPTLIDEQGNAGHNWAPRSAVRMRLRLWTAFFGQGTIVFWNTCVEKDYTAAAGNIYLGPEERGYVGVLTRFTRGFDARAAPKAPVVVSGAGIRAYGLRGPREYALYLVDGVTHSVAVSGVRVRVDPEQAGTGTWIDPATGATLATAHVAAGAQVLTAPTFTTDVALEIR
jgi:hypothetical protein